MDGQSLLGLVCWPLGLMLLAVMWGINDGAKNRASLNRRAAITGAVLAVLWVGAVFAWGFSSSIDPSFEGRHVIGIAATVLALGATIGYLWGVLERRRALAKTIPKKG